MYLGETQLSVARCILLESIYLDRTIAIRHSKFVGSKVKQWATNGSLKRAMDWQTGRVKGKRKSWPAFLVAGQTFGEGCWIQHCDSVLLASHEKRSQKLGKYLTHARSERGKGETEGKRDLTETDWKYNERERAYLSVSTEYTANGSNYRTLQGRALSFVLLFDEKKIYKV